MGLESPPKPPLDVVGVKSNMIIRDGDHIKDNCKNYIDKNCRGKGLGDPRFDGVAGRWLGKRRDGEPSEEDYQGDSTIATGCCSGHNGQNYRSNQFHCNQEPVPGIVAVPDEANARYFHVVSDTHI